MKNCKIPRKLEERKVDSHTLTTIEIEMKNFRCGEKLKNFAVVLYCRHRNIMEWIRRCRRVAQ
jgi:hypothetical protein